ncbi:MAG TPA: hypothetical protein VGQ83_43030, partial [Polyangia bacterium]
GLRELGDALAEAGALCGRELLLRLGAQALGRAAAGRGDLPRQIAQRLPAPLGRRLLAAARDFARVGPTA